jgi:hypothetical protein
MVTEGEGEAAQRVWRHKSADRQKTARRGRKKGRPETAAPDSPFANLKALIAAGG